MSFWKKTVFYSEDSHASWGQVSAGKNTTPTPRCLCVVITGQGWMMPTWYLGAYGTFILVSQGHTNLWFSLSPLRMLFASMALSSRAIPNMTPWNSCSGCWIASTRTWRAHPVGWCRRRSVTFGYFSFIIYSILIPYIHVYTHALPCSLILALVCFILFIHFLFLKFMLSYYCFIGGTLGLLQKCLWYILVKFTPSILLICFKQGFLSHCSIFLDIVNRVSFWLRIWEIFFFLFLYILCISLAIWGHRSHSLFLDSPSSTLCLLSQFTSQKSNS
jgi:hypothetical protein